MNLVMYEELEVLFESPTIKPSFEEVHVILSLFIFDENREGIGRYRLQKELLIGEGTAKSLIKKLNEKARFLVVTERGKRKGHVLTEKGISFLGEVKKKIPLLSGGDLSVLKSITIESVNIPPYFCSEFLHQNSHSDQRCFVVFQTLPLSFPERMHCLCACLSTHSKL